jgi:hypothetical protein
MRVEFTVIEQRYHAVRTLSGGVSPQDRVLLAARRLWRVQVPHPPFTTVSRVPLCTVARDAVIDRVSAWRCVTFLSRCQLASHRRSIMFEEAEVVWASTLLVPLTRAGAIGNDPRNNTWTRSYATRSISPRRPVSPLYAVRHRSPSASPSILDVGAPKPYYTPDSLRRAVSPGDRLSATAKGVAHSVSQAA